MIQKSISLIIIILVVASSIACSNDSDMYNYSKLNKKIEIYMEHISVNKGNYKKKTIDLNKISSQGGQVKGYYEDKNLKYMESVIYGETGRILYDFYFINDSTIYFVETKIKYDKPIYENFKVEEQVVNKFVLINGKLFEYNEELKKIYKIKDVSKYEEILEDLKRQLEK